MKSRRNRFNFGLAVLFVAPVIVAAVFAFGPSFGILEFNTVDYQLEKRGAIFLDGDQQIISSGLGFGKQLDDEGFAELLDFIAQLDSPKHLVICSKKLTGTGLKKLNKMTNIRVCEIIGLAISRDDICELDRTKGLKEIRVWNCSQISELDMQWLRHQNLSFEISECAQSQ